MIPDANDPGPKMIGLYRQVLNGEFIKAGDWIEDINEWADLDTELSEERVGKEFHNVWRIKSE